jgi:hypothetical protein
MNLFDDFWKTQCNYIGISKNQLHWSQQEAIEFVSKLEAIARTVDHHVALTGGCLYGALLYDGELRKDCDIIVYSCRQSTLDLSKLFTLFANEFALKFEQRSDWLTKAVLPNGKSIDFLIPESIKCVSDKYE